MKANRCDGCGAIVEGGSCRYCGNVFEDEFEGPCWPGVVARIEAEIEADGSLVPADPQVYGSYSYTISCNDTISSSNNTVAYIDDLGRVYFNA